MSTYLLVYIAGVASAVAGVASAVAGWLMVTGIRNDRAEWRRLDLVQAELAERYRADVRDLTAPADPAGLDERASIWHTLAHRGELPGDAFYPDPDEPDDDVDQANEEPPTAPALVLPWQVMGMADLFRRPTLHPTSTVDAPGSRFQPFVWAPPPGRHHLTNAAGSSAQAARWDQNTSAWPVMNGAAA